MTDTKPETEPVFAEDGVELLPDRYGVLVEPRWILGRIHWLVGTLYLLNHEVGPQILARKRAAGTGEAALRASLEADAADIQDREAPEGFPCTVEPLAPRGLSARGRLTHWIRYQGWDVSTCCTCGERPAVREYRGTTAMRNRDGSLRWDWMQCVGCLPANPWAEKYESRPLTF